MNILTINDKMFMTYDKSINHLMQAIDLKRNMIIATNPQLMISPNRSHNHPLIRKYSCVAKVENQGFLKIISNNLI